MVGVGQVHYPDQSMPQYKNNTNSITNSVLLIWARVRAGLYYCVVRIMHLIR